MKLKTILLAVSMFFTSMLYADFDKGSRAYEREDYKTVLREWGPLAEQGDANLQYVLGWIYENGKGVRANKKKAVGSIP